MTTTLSPTSATPTATPGSCRNPIGSETETTDNIIAAAIAGDEAIFGELVDRHRRELHVHCYRDWRLVPTLANRMPTAASYLQRPGDTEFRAFKFDVLRIENGAVAEIKTFGPSLFPAFGLSPTL